MQLFALEKKTGNSRKGAVKGGSDCSGPAQKLLVCLDWEEGEGDVGGPKDLDGVRGCWERSDGFRMALAPILDRFPGGHLTPPGHRWCLSPATSTSSRSRGLGKEVGIASGGQAPPCSSRCCSLASELEDPQGLAAPSPKQSQSCGWQEATRDTKPGLCPGPTLHLL